MTQEQKSRIAEIVENNIDQMFCDVLESVDAKYGDATPDFQIKYNQLVDQLIELAIQHAKNNL